MYPTELDRSCTLVGFKAIAYVIAGWAIYYAFETGFENWHIENRGFALAAPLMLLAASYLAWRDIKFARTAIRHIKIDNSDGAANPGDFLYVEPKEMQSEE